MQTIKEGGLTFYRRPSPKSDDFYVGSSNYKKYKQLEKMYPRGNIRRKTYSSFPANKINENFKKKTKIVQQLKSIIKAKRNRTTKNPYWVHLVMGELLKGAMKKRPSKTTPRPNIKRNFGTWIKNNYGIRNPNGTVYYYPNLNTVGIKVNNKFKYYAGKNYGLSPNMWKISF